MANLAPHRRPHHQPTEHVAILELIATRGWSKAQAPGSVLSAGVRPRTSMCSTKRAAQTQDGRRPKPGRSYW